MDATKPRASRQDAKSAPLTEITQKLQAAERELEERSGVGSASSEGRDVLSENQKLQDELERASNRSNVTSSDSSNCTMNSLRVHGRGGSTNNLQESDPRLLPHLQPSGNLQDSDYKNRSGSGSGAGSGSHRAGSHPGSLHSGGGSSGLKGSAASSGGAERGRHKIESTCKDTCASGSGSERTGSGSESRISGGNRNASTVYSSMTNAQQLFMEDALEDLAELHQDELDAMRKLFDDRSRDNKEELADLWSRIVDLRKGERSRENLMELLATARAATTESQDARDDLKDQIAGLLARIEHREQVHLKKVASDKKEADRIVAALKAENDLEQEDMKREVEDARVELENSEAELHEQKLELATKRNAKVKHEVDLARVQELYNKAKREIARRNEANDVTGDDFKESHDMENDLTKSREMQRELNAELAEQRLELLKLKQDHKDQIAAMQARLDRIDTDSDPQGKDPKIMRKTSKQKGGKGGAQHAKGTGKLAAIEEEFDTDDVQSNAASAISGVVSSEGVGVGNLADFDDDSKEVGLLNDISDGPSAADEATTARLNARINDLLQQLEDSDVLNKQLLDDKSNADAEHFSKISRMSSQLKWMRKEQYTNNDLVEAQRLQNTSDSNEQSEDLLKEKEKIVELEVRHQQILAGRAENISENAATNDLAIDNLHQELYYAVESKRIESGRLADTMRELEQVELRHKGIVEDLNTRLKSQTGGTVNQHQLIDRLREVEHERNLMRNAGDCLKVQLQAQLEEEQLQHAVTCKNLETIQSDIIKERQLVDEYKAKLLRAQDTLQGILKDRDAASEQDSGTQAPAESQEHSKLLGWLWCPARGGLGKKIEDGGRSNRTNNVIGPSISAAIWQVVVTLRGVLALQCSAAQLQIMEASRKAFEIWGSSSLRSAGSSVLQNLVFDERSAQWLRQEITSRIQTSSNFWIRQLGCLEFRSKSGTAFDSVVIAAHIPRESEHDHEASIVVIVEPMDDDRPAHKFGDRDIGRLSSVDSSHSGRPRTLGNSGSYYGHEVSSTTSSEIGPNDSVSNIF